MKQSLIITTLSFCLGIFAGSIIFNRPQPPQEKEVSTSTGTSAGELITTKKTKVLPDGSAEIDEVSKLLFNSASKASTAKESNPVKVMRYSVSLLGVASVKKMAADARIGDLPVFIGGQYDFRSPKDSLFSIRVEF